VIGPFNSLERATQAAEREPFDLAILDINLNGQMVYPLADELRSRDIPFMFLTGYGTADLPERFRSLPRMAKPYDAAMLMRQIRRMLRGPQG
jgi:DNA-binding response OmpR family regulator